MILGEGQGDALVFLPGFVVWPSAYRQLLQPLVRVDLSVDVRQLYRPGPAALLGRYSVEDEASDAASLVRAYRQHGNRVWLGGHSRGGQAAWLAAIQLQRDGVQIEGLALIDPVDGHGPRSLERSATRTAQRWDIPTLIVGAGIGGRCAPEHLNHTHFAAASSEASHVVVSDMGHMDVLNGRARDIGRRLCGGGTDPDRARSTVTELLRRYGTR